MGACVKKETPAKYVQNTDNNSDSISHKGKVVLLDQGFEKIPKQFNVTLSNIKVKILDQRICKIRFKFGNFAQYDSPQSMDANGKHLFSTEYSTQIKISDEQLRKDYLDIAIFDQQSEVAALPINLYDIATGPHHFDYDFQINVKKGSKNVTYGKVSFDLKMAQIILIQLKTESILCHMEETLHKQAYRYSMKLVTYTHQFYSEYSETFINPAFTTQNPDSPVESDQKLEDGPVPKLSIKKQVSSSVARQSFGKSIAKRKTLLFNDHSSGLNYRELKWDGESAVILDVEVPINQIPASSLQLCFWSMNELEQREEFSPKKKTSNGHRMKTTVTNRSHPIIDEEDMVLLCETYISLNQVFKHELDDDYDMVDGVKKYTYSSHVEKGLWNHGQQEGTISCNLVITLPAYLSQTIVGVRTNKCIQQGSSVINESSIQIKEISELALYLSKITESVFKLQSKSKNQSGLERMNLRQTLNTNIHNIIDVLSKTHKESIMSFYYKSQGDLFKAQDVMLELAHHLTYTADQLDDSTRERYYQMLLLILQRGELALNQMGFSDRTEATIQKLLKVKLSVGLSYQRLLYQTLKMVLHKLQQKAYSDFERKFIETFCARAFFQIPEFRNRFTTFLVHKEDPPLNEWRGTEFKLDEQAALDYFNKDIRDLFDWESHFYQYLDKEQKGQENRQMLIEILGESDWQKRFGKRGVAFFRFMIEWCNHVDKNVVVKEHIPWQDIPGYRNLLKAFLLEVKVKKIKDFPDSMKQAIFALLSNETLLNIIIALLFSKTQLYDSEALNEMLEIVNDCLQLLVKRNKKLPTQVDIPFFLRAIRSILTDCEHAFCLGKCIWLLYNNYTIFPIEVRKELIDIIFPNLAIKFFMHWSQNVRMIFHHFIIYRVAHLHHTDRHQELDPNVLMQQYEHVRRPKKHNSVFDSNIQSNQIISDFIYIKYARLMHIVEQAKSYCKEEHDASLMEERSLAKAMQQKLLMRRIEERRARLGNTPQTQPPQLGFHIVDSEELNDDPPLKPANSEYNETPKEQLRLQIQQSVPRLSKANTDVIITQSQLKYLIQAYSEYDQLYTRYLKWKTEQNMKFHTRQQNKDSIDINLEKYVVPSVNLQIPCDEREANISNEEDW